MTQGSTPGDGAEVTFEELLALRDGELSDQEEADLLARVTASERAAEMLHQLEQTDQILGRIRDKPLAPDVAAGIEQAIARAEVEAGPERATEADPAGQGPEQHDGAAGDQRNGDAEG